MCGYRDDVWLDSQPLVGATELTDCRPQSVRCFMRRSYRQPANL
jgi:hypothetical protein